jgi:hypothetical protein
MIKEEVDSKRRSAHRKTATSSQRPSLSTKARFRGPLVAQTSIGRLETESPSARKVPANEAVQRNSSANVAVPDSAVTPEVVGSSPVAPLENILQIGIFCERVRFAGSFHARRAGSAALIPCPDRLSSRWRAGWRGRVGFANWAGSTKSRSLQIRPVDVKRARFVRQATQRSLQITR